MSIYDIIIIGGGPAGLTAGIYTARDRMNALLLEKMVLGGKLFMADLIENYPGFPNVSGKRLAASMEEQAKSFGLLVENREALGLLELDNTWLVKTKDKEYITKAVIIATGTSPKRLNIPGEERLLGKGVSYCATCNGPLFKEKEILVIGGGDMALTEAISLSRFASKVRIIHRRDRLKAQKVLQKKASLNPCIEFILSSVITEILGDRIVEAVLIKDLKSGKERIIKTNCLFISIGLTPNTSFLKDILDLDDKGFIITDEMMKTSRKGIYAAGDVRSNSFRKIITACADATIASLTASNYIK